MHKEPRSASPEEAAQESQRLELLGQLAAGVAHDFANILQAVQGVARLMERAADDPHRIRSLAQMLAETARRGNLLTDRMLGFARRGKAKSGRVGLGETEQDPTCDPAEVVSDVCQLLSNTFEAPHSLRCIIEKEGLPTMIRGDYGELEAALINLAFNARDAMPEGGEVTVRVAPERIASETVGLLHGLYARISVTDTGVGMSPDILERAGELFFTTKPAGRGTGLGLAGVRGFAERAGGILHIESQQGHGTVVTLLLHGNLPRASSDIAVDVERAEPGILIETEQKRG